MASQGFESPYLQTPPPRLGSERLRLAGREASDFAINIPTRYAGAIRTWRSTPSLRAAGFEDEDENDDENEAALDP
jgi:hypothetical protein